MRSQIVKLHQILIDDFQYAIKEQAIKCDFSIINAKDSKMLFPSTDAEQTF